GGEGRVHMNLLFDHPKVVADWVGKQNGKPFENFDAAFGVLNPSGTLVGGFVFTGHNGSMIELSIAGYGCVFRKNWQAVKTYVFDQLECDRLQFHTRRSNKLVCRMARKFGLTYEGIARRFYGNEDAVQFSLTRDDLPAFTQRWKLT